MQELSKTGSISFLTPILLFLSSSGKLCTMPKRTYQPKSDKRQKKHGFLVRMATHDGANVIKRRRAHGRAKLSI